VPKGIGPQAAGSITNQPLYHKVCWSLTVFDQGQETKENIYNGVKHTSKSKSCQELIVLIRKSKIHIADAIFFFCDNHLIILGS
jgi:hypothetical protein